MKLVVPYVGELDAVDARLIRLADFFGIPCEPILLTKSPADCVQYLAKVVPSQDSCLVINPRVMGDWIGEPGFPSAVASFVLSRFPRLLVHAPGQDAFDESVVSALSGGSLKAAREIGQQDQSYEVSTTSKDVCEAFEGLTFGPANPVNDFVFSRGPQSSCLCELISIGGLPFMAAMRRDETEVIFLAGQDIVDLSAGIDGAPMPEYFSRLLPHAMALRYLFGKESWRPVNHHASVIIDDPLLRRNYGFLNFDRLLALMKQHNFHTTIAFIPHNFRRSSPEIVRMFRENANRFSLCFHGNDHLGGEFASTDTTLLHAMVRIAEERIRAHSQGTCIDCDRVMVFPQGQFSIAAMDVLRARNFDSAVNTVPYPRPDPGRIPCPLTIGELAQPAVLRYGGFPLFLRSDCLHTRSEDIAFNLFFGRPALIVEHHDVFQHSELLIEAVSRINSIAPAINWSNLGAIVANSILRRYTSDGACHVRAYSRTVQVANASDSAQVVSIEWNHVGHGIPVEQVLRNGTACEGFETDDIETRIWVDLPAGGSQKFAVVYQGAHFPLGRLGFRRTVKAFFRRRLSEARDNYLSKNEPMLVAAKTLQRRFLG